LEIGFCAKAIWNQDYRLYFFPFPLLRKTEKYLTRVDIWLQAQWWRSKVIKNKTLALKLIELKNRKVFFMWLSSIKQIRYFLWDYQFDIVEEKSVANRLCWSSSSIVLDIEKFIKKCKLVIDKMGSVINQTVSQVSGDVNLIRYLGFTHLWLDGSNYTTRLL
jgi:hypothetical protein